METIRGLARPHGLAELESQRDVEEVAAQFDEQRGQLLLEIFIAIRTRAPELSDDGNVPRWDVSDLCDSMQDELKMVRVNGVQYISN